VIFRTTSMIYSFAVQDGRPQSSRGWKKPLHVQICVYPRGDRASTSEHKGRRLDV